MEEEQGGGCSGSSGRACVWGPSEAGEGMAIMCVARGDTNTQSNFSFSLVLLSLNKCTSFRFVGRGARDMGKGGPAVSGPPLVCAHAPMLLSGYNDSKEKRKNRGKMGVLLAEIEEAARKRRQGARNNQGAEKRKRPPSRRVKKRASGNDRREYQKEERKPGPQDSQLVRFGNSFGAAHGCGFGARRTSESLGSTFGFGRTSCVDSDPAVVLYVYSSRG